MSKTEKWFGNLFDRLGEAEIQLENIGDIGWAELHHEVSTARMSIQRALMLLSDNRVQAQRNSRSGIRGVSFKPAAGKWRAVVQHNNRSHHCGYFNTAEQAEMAWYAKRRELGIA